MSFKIKNEQKADQHVHNATICLAMAQDLCDQAQLHTVRATRQTYGHPPALHNAISATTSLQNRIERILDDLENWKDRSKDR